MKQRPDPRPGFSRQVLLLKLQAAIADPALDGLELQQLEPLRAEVSAEVRRPGGGLRVGEDPQAELFRGSRLGV